MLYKENWKETKERFKAWWNGNKTDRPLMRIVAMREEPLEHLEEEQPFKTPEDFHLNAEENIKRIRNFYRTHKLFAEAYPSFDINIGPGSLAVYLGSEPVFSWDTVWYKEVVDEGWKEFGSLKYDPDNYWWNRHFELVCRAQELSGGDFLVNIPDLIENVDILSAMRGPQNLCFDLVDEPELVRDYIGQIDDVYFEYYDRIYEVVKDCDGGCSFTAFHIWGPGKTAKLQCDFSAMMSPGQFRDFVQPSLKKQCKRLDNTLYHLDGPDAIKHLDALMEIEELDALQWTPGAAKPDGGSEQWYPIYDKVKEANKSLWIMIEDGKFNDWVESADRLIKRYGPSGLYLLFPIMSEKEAIELIRKAERDWR